MEYFWDLIEGGKCPARFRKVISSGWRLACIRKGRKIRTGNWKRSTYINKIRIPAEQSAALSKIY